jgi:hypothetical protein
MDKIKHFIEIYNQILSVFAQIHNEDEFRAKSRVIVLVTHMDMFAPEKRYRAKGEIKSQFYGKCYIYM